MTDKQLDKIYKGTSVRRPIGYFRVRIGTYNQDTSFPIELTQVEFDMLYEIRKYLHEQNANLFISIKKEER